MSGEFDQMRAEIARLHEVNDRLRAEIATLRERLRHGFFDSGRLTDAEREAVEWAESAAANVQHPAEDVLRGLLERHTKGGGA